MPRNMWFTGREVFSFEGTYYHVEDSLYLLNLAKRHCH
jgi:hypothetical protein